MNISRTKKPLTRTTEAEVEVDREVIALTQWINDIVSPAGLDVESPMEVERLLERTKGIFHSCLLMFTVSGYGKRSFDKNPFCFIDM